jgi:phospholipid/cholesterol/gamma-HCH transport system ATP-binding protein
MSNDMQPIIEVENLTIGYGDSVVLKNLNFVVREQEIFVILGGSGCGKSTILKHMIGLSQPFAGDIRIRGESMVSSSEEAKERISRSFGVLYQSGALFSSLTLRENIELPLRECTKLPEPLIVATARLKLSLVGLEGFEEFLPSEISGGMRKRAALARAMALDPGILFFDEPSAGLDPISSAELDRLILTLRESLGCTMVIVTHDLDSIFTVADRAIVLDKEIQGIVEEGIPKRMRDASPNPRVREFLNRSNLKG